MRWGLRWLKGVITDTSPVGLGNNATHCPFPATTNRGLDILVQNLSCLLSAKPAMP